MATNNGRTDPAEGPCQHIMQTYFGGLDAAAQNWDPVVKSMAQANLEIIGFWNRRAQAYLEVPTRLTQCRAPQELIAEQMRFWQTAATEYQDSSRRLMKLWAQAVPEMPLGTPKSVKPDRDYISVPEPQQARREDGSGRRAA